MNYLAGELLNVAELTDPDGDALTITSDCAGTWITCSSGDDEVTVGPFPTGELRATLPQVHRASGLDPVGSRIVV